MATGMFEEAVRTYKKGDYAEAERVFLQLAEKDPDQSVYWLNLGNARYRMGKKPIAEQNWQKALTLNPIEANAYLNLGNHFYSQENWLLAITYWQKHLTLQSEQPSVILNLGLAYEQLGNLWQAFDYYRQYLTLSPASKEAVALKRRLDSGQEAYVNNVAYAEKMMKQGHLDKALAAYDQTLTAYPATPKVYKAYGAVLMTCHRYEDAQKAYEAAWLQHPEDGTTLVNLGVAYEKQNRPFEAIWAYQQAIHHKVPESRQLSERVNALIKKHPTVFDVALEQGKDWIKAEHLNSAQQQFDRLAQILDLCPALAPTINSALKVIAQYKNPLHHAQQFFYDQGEQHRNQGNYPKALIAYNKYLEIAPNGDRVGEITQKKATIHEQMGKVIQTMLKN